MSSIDCPIVSVAASKHSYTGTTGTIGTTDTGTTFSVIILAFASVAQVHCKVAESMTFSLS